VQSTTQNIAYQHNKMRLCTWSHSGVHIFLWLLSDYGIPALARGHILV